MMRFLRLTGLFFFCATLAIAAESVEMRPTSDSKPGIQAIESQIQSEGPSPQLYYQLARAEEASGDVVQAAIHYQRALILDPGYRVAQNQYATFAAKNNIGVRPRSWQHDVVAFVHPETLLFIGTGLGWVGAIWIGWIIFSSPQPRLRLAVAIILLLIGSLLFTMGYISDPRIADANLSVVSGTGEAKILSGPASNSALVVALQPGSAVGVLSPRGGWTYIVTPGGAKGWIDSDRLLPVLPQEAGQGSGG